MTHVFFRCHNRQMFLRSRSVKDFLLLLVAKYKRRYQIKVIDFIIMDNHAHFIFQVHSAEFLGHFMRTVNSQLARYINKKLGRDSQALRERYKSPLISNRSYLLNTIKYVFLNRHRIKKKSCPRSDPYCSASWRINPLFKRIENPETSLEKEQNLLAALLDSYEKLGICLQNEEKDFVKALISEAIESIKILVREIYTNIHTIGDKVIVEYRGQINSAYARGRSPPIPVYAI